MQADAGIFPSGPRASEVARGGPCLASGNPPRGRPSGRAGGRAKPLQQTEGMGQVERVERLRRQLSLLPGRSSDRAHAREPAVSTQVLANLAHRVPRPDRRIARTPPPTTTRGLKRKQLSAVLTPLVTALSEALPIEPI
jgi:hypothetical protein